MLKKLSIKTNFVLIGIVIGLFIGVSIKQALGDTITAGDATTVPGTVRADNLTVNSSGQYANGFIVAAGNLLVAGSVGIGTTTPTVKLDVVGTVRASTSFCIEDLCIDKSQLQALLAGRPVSGTSPIDDTTLCSGIPALFSGTPDGVKPVVCSGKSIRVAKGEYIQNEGVGESYLPYIHKTEHDKCVATSPMPNQLQIVSTPNGCRLVGAVYESGKFSFMVSNEFGSATGDYAVVMWTPAKTLTFPSTCAGNSCKICPDAKVGEPYICKIGVATTGDWTGSQISFDITWGEGGNPGNLDLWDYKKTGAEVITTPRPTDAQTSALISGTPTKAGTYRLSFCAGNGTEAHAAFCMDHFAPFVVKP